MKVLSVKQPWAYLLCVKEEEDDKQAVKPIENRGWKLPEKHKGERVLIHASAKPDHRLISLETLFTKEQWKALTDEITKHIIEERMLTSAIIGSVRFTDCVINHPSIWAEKSIKSIVDHTTGLTAGLCGGEYSEKPIFNWLASDPILFDKPILNVKGKLGFWEYNHPMFCPICSYPCHLQKSGDIITDAYCFNCKRDVLYIKKLLCPYCGKICFHDNTDIGVPNWGNPVHECEHCKEMILESEFEHLK